MTTIGVLALQGAVREHVRSIEACGVKAKVVKKVEELQEIDGLILPGGESTAIRKLMDKYGFIPAIREFNKQGKPLFGTCAGMILLANDIGSKEDAHLQLIDITVERNAFGRQVDSFEANLQLKGIAEDYPAVFIRAPLVKSVGDDVDVLSTYNNEIVAVQQGNVLAMSFHPELTNDLRIISYFVNLCKKSIVSI